DVMFNMINITAAGTPAAGQKGHAAGAAERPSHHEDTAIENRERQHQETASKFDMTMTAREHANIIVFQLRYCTKLFKEETVNRITRYFKKILQTLTKEPSGRICEIEIIPETIKKEKLAYFNQNLIDDTVTCQLQDKLKRTFDKHAHKIAIRYGNMELSYRELERKANTISNWIQK
ncbi:MAG: hypothetical protein GY757_03010, partial [bacterium]|nr:hypothetical protein [bacterium]